MIKKLKTTLASAFIPFTLLANTKDPYACQKFLPSPLGSQIMVIGDSNAQRIGQHIQQHWYKDTHPLYSSPFSDEKSLHVHNLYNLGTPATGLLFEFNQYKRYINYSLFSNQYSTERWSDVFANEITQREFMAGDLVIIWVGTNDNQNWNQKTRHSPAWWEHYEKQVLSIALTCQEKKLDCYWVGPAPVRNSHLYKFLYQLNINLKSWLQAHSNVTYLEIFNQFQDQDFVDKYHLKNQAELKILKTLNSIIAERRNYNIETSAQLIRKCKSLKEKKY